MKTVNFNKCLLSLAMIAISVAHADTMAHGITDGVQIKQFYELINPTPKTPFGLTDADIDKLAGHVLWERLL